MESGAESTAPLACDVMGRRVDVDSLVGAREIAERLGLKHPQHVHYWLRHDDDFPKPVTAIGGPTLKTLVWVWPDVERWARRRGRLPKRPAATASPEGERPAKSDAGGIATTEQPDTGS